MVNQYVIVCTGNTCDTDLMNEIVGLYQVVGQPFQL